MNPERPNSEAEIKSEITGQEKPEEKEAGFELDPKTKIFTVPVEIEGSEKMNDQIQIDGKDFTKKLEFHITVISPGRAKELKNAIKENPALEGEINELIKSLDWRYQLSPEKFHLTQDKEVVRQLSKKEKRDRREAGLEEVDSLREMVHREAVIQMAEMPAFKTFLEKLREKGLDLGEVPPVHVTLYTHGDAAGIALNSVEDFEKVNPRKLE